MVTSNSGDGRSRERRIYTVDNRKQTDREDRKDYRKGRDGKGDREGYNKGGNRENNRGGSREDSGKGEKRKSGFRPRGGNQRYGNPYDKDKDEDVRVNRQKPAQRDAKKEQTPDKLEIMNRIEKEKKAIQKKQAESNRKGNKSARQQVRPKRSNNIDWTREYENDSYDDDDLDIYL